MYSKLCNISDCTNLRIESMGLEIKGNYKHGDKIKEVVITLNARLNVVNGQLVWVRNRGMNRDEVQNAASRRQNPRMVGTVYHCDAVQNDGSSVPRQLDINTVVFIDTDDIVRDIPDMEKKQSKGGVLSDIHEIAKSVANKLAGA